VRTGSRSHKLATRPLLEVTQTDFSALVKEIKADHTPIMVDRVRHKLLTALSCYRDTKNSAYVIPITAATKSDKRERDDQERKRALTDEEIRWLCEKVEKHNSTYSQIVRLCLLVPCRSRKIAGMRWCDINFLTACGRSSTNRGKRASRKL
jgi:integrase